VSEPHVDPAVDRPAPDDEHVAELTAGLNAVGYDLFHVAAASSDADVVLSPWSIGIAFGMAHAGQRTNSRAGPRGRTIRG
jgi:serine protease inhibitor